MADSLKDMSKFSGDVAMGSTGAIGALQNLGISVAEFTAASPDEKMDLLADALQGIDDPGKRAALAMQTMGEAGYKMLPLLTQGSEGLQAMRDEANALGVTMDEETASSAAALANAMGVMKSQIMAAVNAIGAALAPALIKISTYITPVLAKVISFVKENKFLVIAIGAVGVALVTLGGLLGGLAIAITAVTAVAGVIFNPMVVGIGLAVAAIAGLIAYFVDFEALFAPIQALSDNLWSTMAKGWQGIQDAVASGDFGLAFEIAMKSAEIALFEALDRLWGGWRDFGADVVNFITDTIKTIQNLWSKGVDWIADKIISVGVAVGLIDAEVGEQMREESKKIGQERVTNFNTGADSINKTILDELKKDRDAIEADLDKLATKAAEQKKAVEATKPPKVEVKGEPKKPPAGILNGQGTTGGFSAAAVVSQLGKDTVQKDQLTQLEQINEGIREQTNNVELGFGA